MGASYEQSGRSNGPSKDYLDALGDYWSGRYRTAIEHVTQILATQPDHDDAFPLYRLWIELLAEEGDVFAMRSLAAHLESRSQVEPKSYRAYYALRGIIHLELDELSAVELMSDALHSPSNNPYVKEFTYRSALRSSVDVKVGQFVSSARGLRDYFHWQLYANYLHIEQRARDYRVAAKRIQQIFPNSPLIDRIEMYAAYEANNFAVGAQLADRLVRQFPSCSEYGIAHAYGLLKMGRHDQAIPVLSRIVSIDGESDVDVISMLGHCYKEDFLATQSERSRERAGYYLKKAETLLTISGLPSALVNHDFTAIRTRQIEGNNTTGNRAWLVRVPQSEYLDIQLADEDNIRLLTTTVSSEAMPGDICFLVTEDYRDEGARQWRVGAIYSISSEPKWHPMHGTQSVMTLVGRPAVSLPIDVAATDRSAVPRKRSSDNAVRAYELDAAALDQVLEKMEEYFADDVQSAKMFAEFTRSRIVS